MPTISGLLVALVLVLAPRVARAGEDDAPAATFHKGQIGISARFGLGLRGIATYDNAIYCGKLDAQAKTGLAPVCTGRSPFRLDLEAAYGVAEHVELLAELRLGLERDFGGAPGAEGPRPLHLSPGARFFFSETTHTKLFLTAQVVFDFTGYKDAAGNGRGMDFGVRSMEGLWIDLHRTYGFYIYIGETAEFARWLAGEFEGGIGFQGRYP